MRATCFASLAVAAFAAVDTVPIRRSKAVKTTLFDHGSIKWEMTSETLHYLDEGIEYLRLTHELTAPIRATDQITFEVAFTSSTDPWINKEKIAEDISICKMVQNTQKTQFWTQTAEDKYNACTTKPSSTSCILYAIEQNTTDNGTFTANSDGANLDWKIPLADDAESNPYCTPYSTAASDFACKKIKCITQRRLDTKDAYDFSFAPTATVPAKMIIKPSRALLGMNPSGCTTNSCVSAFGNIAKTDIEIEIYQRASVLVGSVVAAAAAVSLLAF